MSEWVCLGPFWQAFPAGGEAVQTNAGVGILLNPAMAVAWRDSGECWRAVSSRIVSVYTQLQRCTYSRCH